MILTNEEAYERGWKAAVDAIAKMLHAEAGACIGDIVPGDLVGAKAAHARAGALLTAMADVLAKADRIMMTHRDFIDLTGGPD